MKTLLVDIGKVLLDFDFERSLLRLRQDGEEEEAYLERLKRLWPARAALERGQLGVGEFLEQAKQVIGSGYDEQRFVSAWRQIFTPNEPMWSEMEQLAAEGVRLILFSNTNGLHCPWIFEEFPRFQIFGGRVLSYEVGEMKPARGIYEYAIEAYQLDRRETGYIDDLEENIEMGKEMGFRCHRYELRRHRAFQEWLKEWLNLQ